MWFLVREVHLVTGSGTPRHSSPAFQTDSINARLVTRRIVCGGYVTIWRHLVELLSQRCLTRGVLQIRLPPEVNRILYVRNLPYKITAEEMYDIFGKYGPIRQIRTWVCVSGGRWRHCGYNTKCVAQQPIIHGLFISDILIQNYYLMLLDLSATRIGSRRHFNVGSMKSRW